ncbi:hypothetical protein SH2C18_50210 [Clostridium sediminicola]|uniref:hypothetical protein n=1 Tax=Clostridium sediminicola TaxID=3114879 RepID=UPI0031F24D8B
MKIRFFNVNGKGFWVHEFGDKGDMELLGNFFMILLIVGFIGLILEAFHMPVDKDFMSDKYLEKAEAFVIDTIVDAEEKY